MSRLAEVLQLGAAWLYLSLWLAARVRRPEVPPHTGLLGGAVLSLAGWLLIAASAIPGEVHLAAAAAMQAGWVGAISGRGGRVRRAGSALALAGLAVIGFGLLVRWSRFL